MSRTRDAIFKNIRRALGPSKGDAGQILAEAEALISTPSLFQPQFSDQSNLQRFIAKATSERVTATVSQVDKLQEVPGEVSAYIERRALAPRVVLQPRRNLTALDWVGIKLHNDLSQDEFLAVSVADLAIAETGSVVFLSNDDAPTLLNFLPLHHIVVVKTSLIHRYLEDVFVFVGNRQADQPRNVNIVTGTSGTADIEAKNIRGAHGPKFMHIIIVDSE
jgi:L-lactate dehydrogenase complex protein LldG